MRSGDIHRRSLVRFWGMPPRPNYAAVCSMVRWMWGQAWLRGFMSYCRGLQCGARVCVHGGGVPSRSHARRPTQRIHMCVQPCPHQCMHQMTMGIRFFGSVMASMHFFYIRYLPRCVTKLLLRRAIQNAIMCVAVFLFFLFSRHALVCSRPYSIATHPSIHPLPPRDVRHR